MTWRCSFITQTVLRSLQVYQTKSRSIRLSPVNKNMPTIHSVQAKSSSILKWRIIYIKSPYLSQQNSLKSGQKKRKSQSRNLLFLLQPQPLLKKAKKRHLRSLPNRLNKTSKSNRRKKHVVNKFTLIHRPMLCRPHYGHNSKLLRSSFLWKIASSLIWKNAATPSSPTPTTLGITSRPMVTMRST